MVSEPDVKGRTVLITGASRGLGAALALAFGSAGAQVAIGARDAEALGRVAVRLREMGAECHAASRGVTGRRFRADEWGAR